MAEGFGYRFFSFRRHKLNNFAKTAALAESASHSRHEEDSSHERASHRPEPQQRNQPHAAADFAAMGKCATGVNVITADGDAGRFGVTVSAMSSVSAEPPLLICVHRNNLAYTAIDQNGCFAVNVIEVEHQEVAQVFAGQIKPENGDRFSCSDWSSLETGAPLLESALSSFDCRIEQQINLGTHTVFVGRVVAARCRDGVPLVYAQRSFCDLQPR